MHVSDVTFPGLEAPGVGRRARRAPSIEWALVSAGSDFRIGKRAAIV